MVIEKTEKWAPVTRDVLRATLTLKPFPSEWGSDGPILQPARICNAQTSSRCSGTASCISNVCVAADPLRCNKP